MSAPTSPYATSTDVALLLRNLIHKVTDFDGTTTPPKSTVDTYIEWVCGEINMRLFAAGYDIPLVNPSWPAYQTAYLKMLTAMGTGALVLTGLKPAPAMGPGREGSAQNLLKNLYDIELNNIYNLQLQVVSNPIQASYRIGTAAEKALMEPVGPKSTGRDESCSLWSYTLDMKDIVDEESYYTEMISDYLKDYIYES